MLMTDKCHRDAKTSDTAPAGDDCTSHLHRCRHSVMIATLRTRARQTKST